MKQVIVIKVGGSIFNSGDTTIEDMVALQQQGKYLVVVHGGGNMVTDWLTRQGVTTRFVHGERVTDEASLEVATAVLAGLANKEIVAAINNSGGRAIGISGVDGAVIQGKIKSKDLGYVGEVVTVEVAPLEALLNAGYMAIVSPVVLHSVDKPDEAPPLLNVNGDIVAGELAAALDAERLIFLTDVVGICDQSGKLLPELSSDEAEDLVTSGVASGGMIPKIKACLKALSRAASARIIDGRKPHALLKEVEGKGTGTTIKKGNNS